jgi:hypothetical protein
MKQDCKYVLEDAQAQTDITGKTQFGTISLDGSVSGMPATKG